MTLACTDSCVAALVEVGRRAGVPRVLGVRAAPSGDDRLALTRVEVETGVAASEEFAVTSLTHATPVRARFSPLYLLPFGGAQLVQARPYHAAAYLAVQAALVGWHVVALRAHREALRGDDLDTEADLRLQRNLSASLAAGAVVAGVLEALVVGWWSDHEAANGGT